MNPFLVASWLVCLGIFLVSMLLAYLTKDSKSEAGIVALIFFIITVFLTIACAAAWRQIHP